MGLTKMNERSDGSQNLPNRGEIWRFDPDPVRGREQGNVRPCVILSVDEFNWSDRGLIVIVPMTSTRRDPLLYPYHVEVGSDVSGLPILSVAMCEQVRSISLDRLLGPGPYGHVNRAIMSEIERRIQNLLDL